MLAHSSRLHRALPPVRLSCLSIRVHSKRSVRVYSTRGLQAELTTFARRHAGTIYNVGMTASLCAFLSTDLLTLRSLAVFGTSCAVWFNYQRAPPYHAVIWGLLFISVNLVRIGQILRERREPNFSAEELDIFSRHFHGHGVSTQQFAKIMDAAEWRQQFSFSAGGEAVSTDGEDEIWLLYEGGIMVTSRGDLVCIVNHNDEFPWYAEEHLFDELVEEYAESPPEPIVLTPSLPSQITPIAKINTLEVAEQKLDNADSDSTTSERTVIVLEQKLDNADSDSTTSEPTVVVLAAPAQDNGDTRPGKQYAASQIEQLMHTVRDVEVVEPEEVVEPLPVESDRPVIFCAWRVSELKQLVAEDRALHGLLLNIFGASLARKKRIKQATDHIDKYREILRMALADHELNSAEKRILREYRVTHSITEAEHLSLLAEFEWTEHEFSDGAKQNVLGSVRMQAASQKLLGAIPPDKLGAPKDYNLGYGGPTQPDDFYPK